MITYVALLRGIGPTNPNMHPAKLKSAFEKMGFKNVKTVIVSGNVVFDSQEKEESELEAKIEKALPKLLGFSSNTIVRRKEDIERIIAANPFGERASDAQLYPLISFLRAPLDSFPLPKRGVGYTIPAVYKLEFCTLIERKAVKTPDVMRFFDKHFKKEITSRTWNTLNKIYAKM